MGERKKSKSERSKEIVEERVLCTLLNVSKDLEQGIFLWDEKLVLILNKVYLHLEEFF